MEMWAITTWLRARFDLGQGDEHGFVTAENIGYTVMAVIAAVVIFGFVTPLFGPAAWDWIQTNIFGNTP